MITDKKTLEEKYKDFAKQVVWYPCAERKVVDKDQFLVFLLARAGTKTLRRAIKDLEIKEADCRRALRKARPGVFVNEQDWKKTNARWGIVPALPFPRRDIQAELQEEIKKLKRVEVAAQ